MFFMSSVLLPSVVAMHGYNIGKIAKERSQEAERVARTARIDQLDMEIAYRYSKAMRYLRLAASAAPDQGAVTEGVRKAVHQLTAIPKGDEVDILYPEFEKWSGYALLGELRDKLIQAGFDVEYKTKEGSIQYVLLSLSRLEDEAVIKSNVAPGAVAQRLRSAMFVPPVEQRQEPPHSRWEKGFPGTDCELTKIFC